MIHTYQYYKDSISRKVNMTVFISIYKRDKRRRRMSNTRMLSLIYNMRQPSSGRMKKS